MKKYILTFIFSFSIFFGWSQNIKTSFIWNSKKNNNSSVVSLKESLTFKFDDLDADFKNYEYTLVHCDSNWNPSKIFKNDYIEGFQTAQVRNYSYSDNTYVDYTHYSITLPNKDMKFTKSGNYELLVFHKYQDNIITKYQFSVYQPLVGIDLRIVPSTKKRDFNTHQQLDFKLIDNSLNLNQNLSELKVICLQNENWHTQKTFKKPTFINRNEFNFTGSEFNLKGGNEYLFFDTKFLNAAGIKTKKIIQDSIYTHIMEEDYPQVSLNYIAYPDVNGFFYIRNANYEYESDTSADYIYVDLALVSTYYEDKELYVWGKFNNYKPTKKHKLEYDFERQIYTNKILLKQGYYNYQYVLKDTESSYNTDSISGNSNLTENNYSLLVYFKPWNSRYDQLIGFAQTNSIPNLKK